MPFADPQCHQNSSGQFPNDPILIDYPGGLNPGISTTDMGDHTAVSGSKRQVGFAGLKRTSLRTSCARHLFVVDEIDLGASNGTVGHESLSGACHHLT